jgi:uncharacterized protein involved in exopolysaccharide biosynthesis
MTSEQSQASDRPAPPPAGYFMPMQQPYADDEIDLREIFGVLKSRWKIIVASVVAVTLVAGLYAFLAPKRYRADALVAPLDNSNGGGGGGMAAALGQLGGLASLAGVSVGGGGSDKDISVATLQSRALIQGLIKDGNLLPLLFEDEWDASKKAWDVESPDDVPTLLDGSDLFEKKILKVSEDKKTGLVTVEVEWTSPELAAQWTNQLVSRANVSLQQRALAESEHHLKFLQDQLQQTSLVDVRQSIFTLVENELKNSMVAKGNDQYAFKVIDPAVVPEKKVWPKRGLILVLGFFAGLFLSVVGVLAWHSLSSTRES